MVDFASARRTFVYRIDASDKITSVNSDWLSFARENEASFLDSDSVIGRPLFDFVTGKETRHLYQLLIDRIRSTRSKIVIPFRCDGPCVRRFMELEISAGTDGQVLFESRTLRDEPRESGSLFESSIDRSDDFVVVCSWCKRIENSGDWVEVELAVERLGLFDSIPLPQITHGICPECGERLQNTVSPAG